ncbi:hypothetical protein BFP70_08420 [Thioclava sp. SK-1]|uniref:HPP family protein n=1 Tax=Thioclava sp. SK-1 TaxID=1889770 RepID=UPI000824411F|nr:HPP family protein [Thioclava sp. SK-1]OCX66123.1 hypothetical protein BFP70_08420 [Thioclava sp. SK-1]
MVDILRGALGAGLAVLLVALVIRQLHQSDAADFYLVSSFGSAAVLLFVLPNSPLAQPWAAFFGMLISATVSVAILRWVPPPYADGLAVAGAIAAMQACRALHPPAAGIALLAVMEFEAGRSLPFSFALFPIGTVTLLLILCAMLWNRAFGIHYPIKPLSLAPALRHRTTGPARELDEKALQKILLDLQQSANISTADMARVMAAAEHHATEALLQGTLVQDLMTRAPVTVTPEAPLSEIVRKMTALGIKSLPVVDPAGRFLGVVDYGPVMARMSADLAAMRTSFRLRPAPQEAEAQALMATNVVTVDGQIPIAALLERFSHHVARMVPVRSGDRLAGVITRTDLIGHLLNHIPDPVADATREEKNNSSSLSR